jgi:hypothetical protein
MHMIVTILFHANSAICSNSPYLLLHGWFLHVVGCFLHHYAGCSDSLGSPAATRKASLAISRSGRCCVPLSGVAIQGYLGTPKQTLLRWNSSEFPTSQAQPLCSWDHCNKAGSSCISGTPRLHSPHPLSVCNCPLKVKFSVLNLHRCEQGAFAGHCRNHDAYEKSWGWIHEAGSAGPFFKGPVVIQAGAARFGSVQKYLDFRDPF